jgi:hypothetical protein
MRKVFLEDLPKRGKLIDWKSSVGYIMHFVYDDIDGYFEIINYIIEKECTKLEIIYNNKIYVICTDSIKQCKLGGILNKYTADFKVEIGKVFKDDKRDITIIDREYRKYKKQNLKYYKYHCNKDNYEDWIEENHLIKRNNGCTCCSSHNSVLGINTIWDTDKWMIPIINDDKFCKTHTYSSHDEIYPTCPYCGRKKSNKMKVSNIYYKHSIGCSCSDKISYPEKVIFGVLEQLNLDFKTQLSKTTFKWCKDYKYDFYFELNNDQYIIETHGMQHYEDTSGVYIKTLKEEQENDRTKKELALYNGIKEDNYIIIDCRKSTLEWIRDNKDGILNSRLNELFDLSTINWNKVEESALSNWVKVACDLKKNNPELTALEIGKNMNLSSVTIRKYLKKGTKIGWCIYNSQKEKKKGNIKNSGKSQRKQVEIFKDKISLGVFESGSDLERQSEKLFGVKLLQGEISKVCLEKRKYYKGFSFKYV